MDAKIEDSQARTIEDAQAYLDAVLKQRMAAVRRVTFTTRQLGALPGQVITINLARRGVNAAFLIDEVDTQNDAGNLVLRTVTAIENTYFQPGWRQTVQAWTDGGSASTGGVTVAGGGSKSFQWTQARSLGGNRHNGLFTQAGAHRFYDWREALVDYDFYAEQALAIAVSALVWLATVSGTVTPSVVDDLGATVATGTGISTSTPTLQTIVIPFATGQRRYHVECALAGGATADTVNGWGDLEIRPS